LGGIVVGRHRLRRQRAQLWTVRLGARRIRQVRHDGFGAGVETLFVEGRAQPHDPVFDLDRHCPRIVMGPA
jgi:hypothetical protein